MGTMFAGSKCFIFPVIRPSAFAVIEVSINFKSAGSVNLISDFSGVIKSEFEAVKSKKHRCQRVLSQIFFFLKL